MKITERNAKSDKLVPAPDPSGKQKLYWDDQLKGFGILVSGKTKTRSYVVQRELRGGRTRRHTIGRVGVVPQEVAREEAKRLLAEMMLGRDPKQHAGRITLKAALADHLKGGDLSPKTKKTYTTLIDQHTADWLDRRLSEITSEMAIERHTKITEAVAADGKHDGRAVANTALRALRAVYASAAEKDKSMGPNPFALPKKKWFKIAPRERHLSAEQMPRFYEAVMALENPVARDYILMLMFSGLRRSECASLKWSDIDLVGRKILLSHKVTKSRKRFDLPLSDFAHDLLVARRAAGGGANDWVFPANSRSGHLEEASYPLQIIQEKTGIAISAHDLRRGFATYAEDTPGVSLLALKALLNHSSGRDVTAGYIRLSPERLRRAAQAITDRLKELCAIVKPQGATPLRQVVAHS